MKLTPETVRAVLEDVTPGPWYVEYEHGTTQLIAGGECTMCNKTYYPWVPDNDGDWHLFAMAPDLASAYLAQQEEIERLRDALTSCMGDLESLARSEFDGVWLESDFEIILLPYRQALAAYNEAKGEQTDG